MRDWQRLADAIQGLAAAYEAMLALAGRKRAALVSVDLPALSALLVEEQGLVERIRRLESDRMGLMRSLSRQGPPFRPDMTMAELLERTPPMLRARLADLHRRLGDAVERASSASEENAMLVRSALGAVGFHLNRVSGAAAGLSYGQRGDESVTRTRTFDFEA